jgi:hypothetical protein
VKRNRYSRALKHLKSTELDEKIQRLNEAPTNSIDGVYSLNPPGFRVGIPDPPKVYYPDVDGNWPAGIPGTPGELSYTRPEGYWSGGSDWGQQVVTDFSQDYLLQDPTGKSTTGIINDDGVVLAQLPPGGENFILGPIVDGFVPLHTFDAYTNIGYIQKDTRQFVLLARINGQWKSNLNGNYPVWDGSVNQLTIYNQNFTLAMAEWIKNEIVANKYTSNVPYFYSGGVPQVPQSAANCPNCPPGMFGGNGVGGRPFGRGGNPSIGTKQGNPTKGGPKDANLYGINYKTGKKQKLSPKDYAAYKAGGGDAAAKKGKSIGDIIAQGKLNQQNKKQKLSPKDYAAYKAGGGDAAAKKGKSIRDIIAQGKVNQQNRTKNANLYGIDYKTGKKEKLSAKDYAAYKSGGGDAKIKQGYTKQQVIDIGKQNLGQYDFGSKTPNPYTLSSQELKDLLKIQQQQGYSAARDAQVNLEISKLQNLDKVGKLTPQLKLDLLALQSSQGLSTLAKGADVASDYLNYLMLAKGVGKLAVKGAIKGATGLVTKQAPGLSAATKSTIGSTGLDFKGFQAITQGKPYIPSTKPQVLGTGAYSAPKVGASGGPFGGTGAAKYAGTQGSLGGAKTPGGVVQSVVPGGAPKIPFIEPQAKVPAKTFDKGVELSKKLADPAFQAKYANSPLMKKLIQQVAQAGYKPGQTSIPYSELPKGLSAISQIAKAATVAGVLGGLSQIQGSTPQSGPGSNQAKIQQVLQNPTIKNLGATNYSAFKAGGGEAALKQQGSSPESLANIINQGKQNISQYGTNLGNKTSSKSRGVGRYLKLSHEPHGELISESRKRILREIKKPYVLPEIPKQKYKINFSGKYSSQNTPDVTASKKTDEMVKAQNAAGQTWRTNDKYWKGYETTERMNIIYDNLGHGSQYWDEIINENQRRNGWRDREVQEQLNLIAHEKAMIRENPDFKSPFSIEIEEQETMKYDKDPLFKRVAQKLKKEIDYPDKPARLGYPNNPPPEQKNGWHPEYGEVDAYYNRLDPHSANAMPFTGNPKIDAKVEKARKVKRAIGKKN